MRIQCLDELGESDRANLERKSLLVYRRGPDSPSGCLDLGKKAVQSGKWSVARQMFERACSLIAQSPAAKTKNASLEMILAQSEFESAEIYGKAGLWNEASSHFGRVIDQTTFTPKTGPWNRQGMVMLAAGNIRDYSRLCQAFPKRFAQ